MYFLKNIAEKTKLKQDSYLEVMKLTKLFVGLFCSWFVMEGFFVCGFSNILFNASQYLPWQNQHSDYFCTEMSENECVYCQENVSFHLEPLK